MNKDLIEYMKNIKDTNRKGVVEYEDADGNYSLIPTGNLFTSVEYYELDKQEYKTALFKQVITDKDYKTKFTKRVVDKSTITKDKSDQGILVDKEVKVYQIWIIKNALNCSTCFVNKEDALKVAKDINNKYFERIDA